MCQSSWTPLHARLHQILRDRQWLPKGTRLLVAVSGGQDSLCLIKLLIDLQPKWGWQLAIVHCNHRWRVDAAANADHVSHLATQWQIPCQVEVADPISPSEAEARVWRYQVFSRLAEQGGYTGVITGHTASDRAETLLYNLFRGSGADGLQSLTWYRALTPTIALVRPLLNVTRAETAEFCRTQELPIWEDATNHDLTYARNRIRHEVLPYLTTHFNPQIEQTLAQTAELLTHEVDYLEAVATELRQQASHWASNQARTEANEPSSWALNRVSLQTHPLALQRRVMRQFLQTTIGIAPTFDHIEKLVALVTAPQRSRTDPFPGGAIAEVEGDWIWVRQL
jgi:tRNA(Ile)-lysidine synthase